MMYLNQVFSFSVMLSSLLFPIVRVELVSLFLYELKILTQIEKRIVFDFSQSNMSY